MYYFVQIENATVFTNFKHCELFDVTKQRGRKEEETEMDIYQKTEIGYCDHVAPFNLHPQPISP